MELPAVEGNAFGNTYFIRSFWGAWFAFKLEENRRKVEQQKKNISACNKAIYILSKQYGILLELQIKIIEPFRDSPEQWR